MSYPSKEANSNLPFISIDLSMMGVESCSFLFDLSEKVVMSLVNNACFNSFRLNLALVSNANRFNLLNARLRTQ